MFVSGKRWTNNRLQMQKQNHIGVGTLMMFRRELSQDVCKPYKKRSLQPVPLEWHFTASFEILPESNSS